MEQIFFHLDSNKQNRYVGKDTLMQCRTVLQTQEYDVWVCERSPTAPATTLDGDFVNAAADAGMFEIFKSQMAKQRHDVSVYLLQVADMIVWDHTQAAAELQHIAVNLGLALPRQMSAKYQQIIQELQPLQGRDFECRYYDVQIPAHQEAIRLFENYVQSSTSNPQLLSFAQTTLPTLRKHLAYVEQGLSGCE